MHNSNRKELAHGVYASLLTPRRRSLAEPDTAAFLDYLDRVVKTGVNGVVLFGATGEFVHFDVADRMHALGLAIKRSRVPVLVNVSHSTLDGAIALADDAIDSGAAGVLLAPPYFYRYRDGEIAEFYLRFVESIARPAPVYLYNLPLFTNPLSEAVAVRLLASGGFAGIEDLSGDWTFFEALRSLQERVPFQLLAGCEQFYLRARRSGAQGIVSGLASVLPELIVALECAFCQGNTARAETLDRRVAEFLSWVHRFPTTVGIKQAAAVRGWNLDYLAVPLSGENLAARTEYDRWLREWLPGTLREAQAA